MALLDVRQLVTHFHTREGVVRAVDGVSLQLAPGEAVGVVGESGSGKSVTFYSLLGLVPQPPARIEGGEAWFDGRDLLQLSDRELRRLRGRRMAMIFQDPLSALNPYLTIGNQVVEPLRIHGLARGREAWQRGVEALRTVGLRDPQRLMRAYPHEFSGGMRQRIGIACALLTQPELLIADEPTTALDVTVQAQILELIASLQQERKMAMVLITHDLSVVAGRCRRVYVMYAGRIVEHGPVREVYALPRHPYTRALLDAIPSTVDAERPLQSIPGTPPDLLKPVQGCPFAARCAYARPRCRKEQPQLVDAADGRATACLRVQDGELAW